MKYSKFKKCLLYFNVLKSADCLCKCLLGVIRTLGGIETYTRSHQIFQAAIGRSAAIRGGPQRPCRIRTALWGPLEVRPGTRMRLRRRSRASEPIRTDPNRSEPIRTDPNRSEPAPTGPNRPQLTSCVPSGPHLFWVRPGFQCSGCSFFF